MQQEGLSLPSLTGGVVLTRLDEDQKSALLSTGSAGYFSGHGRVLKKWVVISIDDPSQIDRYLPFIIASYTAARVETGSGT
jgi:hypothetical protein